MKPILAISVIILTGLFSTGSTSYTPTVLDHVQAKALITKELSLPRPYEHSTCLDTRGICWGNDLNQFVKDGLLTYQKDPNSNEVIIQITEIGKKGFVGEYNESKGFTGRTFAYFKLYDIVFNSITGVSINSATQIATVRFSLKAINITPYGYSLTKVQSAGCSGVPYVKFKLDQPINGEMTFKKFDTGWLLDGLMVNKSLSDRFKIIFSQNGRY